MTTDHRQVQVLWQRVVDPGTHVWVRADEVVVLGDELLDLRTGQALTEARSSFLGLRPWSRQRWDPSIMPIAAQGPGGEADRCDARVWQGFLVVGKYTEWNASDRRYKVLVEARHITSGETAWQHRVSGRDDLAMWVDWLTVRDGAVLRRPPGNHYGHESLRYPDPRTGECQWSVSWDAKTWRIADEAADDLVIIYDTGQPVVAGVAAATGRFHWLIRTAQGTLPAAVRATDRHVVVCSFPEDTNRHQPRISHGPVPPIRLAGACECGHRAAPGADPNVCRRCSGFLRPWMTISVHDRDTGAELWSHRWPWHESIAVLAVVEALAIASSPSGWVVVTQEERSLYARRLDDKTLLWTQSASDIVGLPRQTRRPRALHGIGHPGHMAWIWLQEASGSVAENTRKTDDVFIHPVTGESVALVDVFYLSGDSVALAWTQGTLTCLALPADHGA